MFHVERRFSEEIVRGWELFHVEHFGVAWVQYRRPCSTWNHLSQTRGESAKFGLPGKNSLPVELVREMGTVFVEITANRISSESRWNAMFHVEQSRRIVQDPMPEGKVLCYQVDGSTTTGEFFVPTRSSRRSEFGTWMGSAQSQVRFFWISGRSRAPIQRITCFAAICCEFAHSRKAGNSPSARE